MKSLFVITCCFFISTSSLPAQSIDTIVNKIAKINQVQRQFVGFAGEPSENYQNYEKLLEKADTSQLLKLIKHENDAVACYAGWALIDKGYPDLQAIFRYFLSVSKPVSAFNDYTHSKDLLSNEFYHRYWNEVEDQKNDPRLFALDSMILYQDNPYWLILLRALENRVYPKSYNDRIATLAFNKGHKEAIFYLSNWYKAEYVEEIKLGLLDYLVKTDFSNRVGTSTYYNVVQILLSFQEEAIQQKVIEKLKKDKHWTLEKEGFMFLLNRFSIYGADLED